MERILTAVTENRQLPSIVGHMLRLLKSNNFKTFIQTVREMTGDVEQRLQIDQSI